MVVVNTCIDNGHHGVGYSMCYVPCLRGINVRIDNASGLAGIVKPP